MSYTNPPGKGNSVHPISMNTQTISAPPSAPQSGGPPSYSGGPSQYAGEINAPRQVWQQETVGPGYEPSGPGYGSGAPGYGSGALGYESRAPGYGRAGPTTVIVQPAPATFVTQLPSFDESPVHMRCPCCNADIMTMTNYVSGTMTWLICLGIFAATLIVACAFLFCWVPFCISSTKDVEHKCPNCNNVVGRMKRM